MILLRLGDDILMILQTRKKKEIYSLRQWLVISWATKRWSGSFQGLILHY